MTLCGGVLVYSSSQVCFSSLRFVGIDVFTTLLRSQHFKMRWGLCFDWAIATLWFFCFSAILLLGIIVLPSFKPLDRLPFDSEIVWYAEEFMVDLVTAQIITRAWQSVWAVCADELWFSPNKVLCIISKCLHGFFLAFCYNNTPKCSRPGVFFLHTASAFRLFYLIFVK